ncbi:PP0621 family protein [Sphaerotilus natans]|uniref:PP0621 family protein n=1 Tax=Sphaerotilus natans TaxID=34103 RepID=UPI00406C89E3
MLGKLLLIILAILGIVWLLRGARRTGGDADRTSRAPQDAGALQPMARCAHCGLHLPQAEALLHDGQAYCGRLHRLAGPRAPYGRR